jgi:cyclopropane-fatty-acyl-phospholipid synthase
LVAGHDFSPAVAPALRRAGDPGSRQRAREAIQFHYDLPVEFWQKWLDKNLLYTCAHFARPDQSLDDAQLRKLELICRKLALAPGERLLDIGCGWGALEVHAGRHGADVVGVTLSELQAHYARAVIGEAGLGERCRVELRDFRDIEGPAFDKAAAIGIIEHVRGELQPEFFAKAHKALRPGGLFLVQGITRSPGASFGGSAEFMDQYVFPDAELQPISAILTHAESAGFEVRDVECMGEHYVLTLRHWLRRLEAAAEPIQALVGAERYRAFRAYLAGFAAEFRRGNLNVYQTLLATPATDDQPLGTTRAGWYPV